jgi:hypothetical protein
VLATLYSAEQLCSASIINRNRNRKESERERTVARGVELSEEKEVESKFLELHFTSTPTDGLRSQFPVAMCEKS